MLFPSPTFKKRWELGISLFCERGGGDPSLLYFSEVVPAALEWEGGGREKEEPAGEEKNTNLPKE